MDDREKIITELKRILNWMSVALDHLAAHFHEFKAIAAETKLHWGNTKYKGTKAEWKGAKQGQREFAKMATGLPVDKYRQLDAILKEKFGEGLEDVLDKKKKIMEKIYKRKSIKNADEYRMVDERVDELSQAKSNPEEIQFLNSLLTKYTDSLPKP
mgnify:CR=1 FL=1